MIEKSIKRQSHLAREKENSIFSQFTLSLFWRDAVSGERNRFEFVSFQKKKNKNQNKK